MAPEFETKGPGDGPKDHSPVRYDGLAITLHWAMAVLIAANLLLALVFETLDGEARGQLIRIHKSIGICVLALAVLRLAWRFMRAPPPFLASLSPSTRCLAKAVHWILLWLPLVLALSGWAMISADKGGHRTAVFGLFNWPRIGPLVTAPPPLRERLHDVLGATHLSLALVLVVLVVGHIGAALMHQFIDRQPELGRMAPNLAGRRSRT